MVKTNPQTPQKCLSVAEKIRFGIPGSHRTEPNQIIRNRSFGIQ